MEYVGRTVAKQFPGFGKKKFKGEIISADKDAGVQYFKVKYEDGDEEELGLPELKRILLPASTGAAQKRKAPAAATAAGSETPEDEEEAGLPDTAAGPSKRQPGVRGGKEKARAAAPVRSLQTELPGSVDEQQLKGMVEEVAAKSKALEVSLVRYPFPDQQPAQAADGPKCSRVVTCGSMCYTSALRPAAGNAVADDAPQAVLAAEYETQAAEVLEQLDAALQEAGSSRDHLVAVTVLLKDTEAGFTPFAAAYNKFVNRHALPAVTVQESFLGQEELLVSVTATAAVPSKQYV